MLNHNQNRTLLFLQRFKIFNFHVYSTPIHLNQNSPELIIFRGSHRVKFDHYSEEYLEIMKVVLCNLNRSPLEFGLRPQCFNEENRPVSVGNNDGIGRVQICSLMIRLLCPWQKFYLSFGIISDQGFSYPPPPQSACQ